MSWWPVIALCVAAYALKGLGLVLGNRIEPETAERWSLHLLVVPVLAALILVQTFSTGNRWSCSTPGRPRWWWRAHSCGCARRSSSWH